MTAPKRVQPRRRRLSRTRVEQAVRETKTRPAVHFVGDTRTLDDGRKQVLVHFLDRFSDLSESPAAVQLVDALKGDGWLVVHERGQAASRLVVTEPEEG